MVSEQPDADQSELDAVVAALGIEQSVIADLGGWDAVILNYRTSCSFRSFT
jgi:hypothetical protein